MLRIRNLNRLDSRTGEPALLAPVDLDVENGTCISITGLSGSGKSVLLRAICDLDPVEGEVSLNDQDRENMSGPDWRTRVAYVPADSGWWHDRTGAHFSDPEAALPIITSFGLPEDALDWPVQQLSTGERQRLSMARALVRNPEVLLLDEPTSGLDPETTEKVEAVLRERLAAGNSIVLVTHDPEQRNRLASQHYEMKNGQLSPLAGGIS